MIKSIRILVIIVSIMMLYSCRRVPMLHHNSPVVHERKANKADLTIGVSGGVPGIQKTAKKGIRPLYGSVYGNYQINEWLYVGLHRKRSHTSKLNDIKVWSLSVGCQNVYKDFYFRNSIQYGYGKLRTRASTSKVVGSNPYVLFPEVEIVPNGRMQSNIHRYQAKSVLGIKKQWFEASIHLRYFRQNFRQVKGDLYYHNRNYIDYVQDIDHVNNLDATLFVGATLYNLSVYMQLSGKNMIRKNYDYVYDDTMYIGLGASLKLNMSTKNGLDTSPIEY